MSNRAFQFVDSYALPWYSPPQAHVHAAEVINAEPCSPPPEELNVMDPFYRITVRTPAGISVEYPDPVRSHFAPNHGDMLLIDSGGRVTILDRTRFEMSYMISE